MIMTKVRAKLSETNRYYIDKHAFYSAYHYALQYKEWKSEYETLSKYGDSTGVDYSRDKTGSSPGVGDPTFNLGTRLAKLKSNIDLIESSALEVNPILYKWLIKAVTEEFVSYNYLRTVLNIPCGKNFYYKMRRKFYYILSQKLNWL